MGIQHVLVLPLPAQGHVNPLMRFSKKLAQHGFKVTFVNTDFNHKRVVSATNEEVDLEGSAVRLISIPDGLGPEDDRNDLASLITAILRTMPSALEKVIKDNMNALDHDVDGGSEKTTVIVVDLSMAWALEVADKLGIKGAVFSPHSAAVFVLEENISKLIERGIINGDGFPISKGKFQLFQGMPVMHTDYIPWCLVGYSTEQNKLIFDYVTKFMYCSQLTDWWLCNTSSQLEPGALSFSPKILPIGPLMESADEGRSLGQFWEEDLSCLNWLNKQPPCSVIYIAFGSFTVFDPLQFKELALGLDLTNRPFLWVVREDVSGSTKTTYPDEFQGTCGKIVTWAPQQKVLNHPSTACFISHCGWNSTMEGVFNGVPFLCWPYFADQFVDKVYVCDEWKVGLGFDLDEKGLISRWEIKKKVDQLLGDDSIRERSQKLKEMVVSSTAEAGQSYENFSKFEAWLKG